MKVWAVLAMLVVVSGAGYGLVQVGIDIGLGRCAQARNDEMVVGIDHHTELTKQDEVSILKGDQQKTRNREAFEETVKETANVKDSACTFSADFIRVFNQ